MIVAIVILLIVVIIFIILLAKKDKKLKEEVKKNGDLLEQMIIEETEKKVEEAKQELIAEKFDLEIRAVRAAIIANDEAYKTHKISPRRYLRCREELSKTITKLEEKYGIQ